MIITVIIPVGSTHERLSHQAVQSCLWQCLQDNFEVIVVNDTPDAVLSYNDARVIVIDSPVRGIKTTLNRAAVARNAAIARARGEYIIFLDADDYLLPTAFEVYLRGHLSHNQAYSYSGHYNNEFHLRPMDYDQRRYAEFNIHPITAFIPTEHVRAVGGFDERAPGWEDWTLYLRLAIAGYCGAYVNGPVFVYRDAHSVNHIVDVQGGHELMDRVIEPYKNAEGAIIMASCCGGGGNRQAVQAIVGALPAIEASADNMRTVEYIGPMVGTFTIVHPDSKRQYRAGRNSTNRFLRVPVEDSPYFIAERQDFREVMPPSPPVPPPPIPELVTMPEQAAIAPSLVPVADDPSIARDDVGMLIEQPKAKRGRPKNA